MDKPTTLAAALVAFQADMPKVDKAHVAKIPGRDDRPYADLSDLTREVMPRLAEHGLSFTAKPTLNAAGRFVLAFKLLHVSGECEEGEYPIPETGGPQVVGGNITYARRYALAAITGVVAESDDDGAVAQAASGQRQSAQRTAAPRTSRPTAARARPPLPHETADQPVMISEAQQRKLHACLRDLDKGDRDAGLAEINRLLDRTDNPITSTKELTKVDAGIVIDNLDAQLLARQDPDDEPVQYPGDIGEA